MDTWKGARFLGVDVGTSGLRIAALDARGDCLFLAKDDWPAPESTDSHEQDPMAWWQAFDRLMGRLGDDGQLSGVQAIAFTGTSGTVLTASANGRPEGPALMYNAPAGSDELAALRRLELDPNAQLAALARWRHLAEQRGQTGLPVSQADWFAWRLTDRHVSDSNNALKWGFDPVDEQWPTAIAERFGRQLPAVQRPGTIVGPIDEVFSTRWQLPAMTRVVAGTTDSMAALWASGARAEGDGVTSLGSTLALKLISRQPVFDVDSGVYSHRFGERFAISGASNSGGRVLAQFFSREALDHLSASIDPERPDTLGYWPLPGRGERFPVVAPTMAPRLTPRPDDPVDFLAGLLRGIARIEKQGYRRFAQLGASPVRQVYSAGGGAHNAVFRQIRAHALKVPVVLAEHTEAAVGAARLAQRGAERQ